MYSDCSRKRSIKDRLGENVHNSDEPRRQDYKKRFQASDGAWKHDMYEDADNKASTAKNKQKSSQDLRARLKKNGVPVQSGNDASSVIKDLREKLSGPVLPPQASKQAIPVPQLTSSIVKATTKAATTVSDKPAAVPVKAPNVAKSSSGAPQAEAMPIASFLQSLGLSKYLITFRAEEIDMPILQLMKDAELKELGIPMGPRKKILLALAQQCKH